MTKYVNRKKCCTISHIFWAEKLFYILLHRSAIDLKAPGGFGIGADPGVNLGAVGATKLLQGQRAFLQRNLKLIFLSAGR